MATIWKRLLTKEGYHLLHKGGPETINFWKHSRDIRSTKSNKECQAGSKSINEVGGACGGGLEKNERLYRNLGLLLGIAVVIILI